MTTDLAAKPSRFKGPLRSAPFRWLITGATITNLGNAIAPVALAFAVLDLGGSATELGTVIALYALADVVTVLFGGVLGDRLPRQFMMVGTAVLAGLAQAMAAAALIGGFATIPMLAVIGMANGALGALNGPSSAGADQADGSRRGAVTSSLAAADLPERGPDRRASRWPASWSRRSARAGRSRSTRRPSRVAAACYSPGARAAPAGAVRSSSTARRTCGAGLREVLEHGPGCGC